MKTTRSLPGLTREAEEKQLTHVIEVAQENLEEGTSLSAQLGEDLHELLESYGAKDKEALSLWHNVSVQYDESLRNLVRLKKARKHPYFGRIDLFDETQGKEEVYYIGRVGISRNVTELEVIDWRAPVADVYYANVSSGKVWETFSADASQGVSHEGNQMGRTSYRTSDGTVYDVDLRRKRTYEIADDRLIDFYDSDIVANDELLTKYLAKNKKAVLGEIIATIQAEQNQIIRKSPRQNIIVQGVAGSGKTTVAMHRISYILYNYAEDFRPEDFYIVGSSRILLDYITSVLPDLDVEGIRQMTMEELFIRLLYEDWDPKKQNVREVKEEEPEWVKGTLAWFLDLEAFCSAYEWEKIPRGDVFLRDVCLLGREDIENYIKENPKVSMQNKIRMLNQRLLSKLENELTGREISYTEEEKPEIFRQFRNYFGTKDLKESIYDLYQQFLKDQAEHGKEVEVPTDSYDVYDLSALAYLYKRLKETELIREASHVVIDEAQDFGMMAYAVLKFCMRGCTFTIMGDVSQNIRFSLGLHDWEELKTVMLTGTFDSFNLLKKSYRNTVEISNFAVKILRHGNFPIYPVEPVLRHGPEPKIDSCDSLEEMKDRAVTQIRNWKSQGFETIAVICRRKEECEKIFDQLKDELPVKTLSDGESTDFEKEILILPVEYTKGLEFDAVLLWNPTGEAYPATDGHVRILYVAATRALHELSVISDGNLTPLLKKPPAKERRENQMKRSVRPFHWILGNQSLEKAGDVPVVPKPDKVDTKQENPDESSPEALTKENLETSALAEDYISEKKEKVSQKQSAGDTGKNKSDKKMPTHMSDVNDQNTAPKDAVSSASATLEAVKEQIRWYRSYVNSALPPLPLNASPYQFGDRPRDSLLAIPPHEKIDLAIRKAQKRKNGLRLVSNYGVLWVIPVTPQIIRIVFERDCIDPLKSPPCIGTTGCDPVWSGKITAQDIELETDALRVCIGKKSGAVRFYTKDGRLLLKEQERECRQIHRRSGRMWNFFAFERQERLRALGPGKLTMPQIRNNAFYLSHGQKTLRLPCLFSDKGYALAIAAYGSVLGCTIPVYGSYVCTEGEEKLDYYFIGGHSEEELHAAYRYLSGNRPQNTGTVKKKGRPSV